MLKFLIHRSVGRNGQNAPRDVLIVQKLLNFVTQSCEVPESGLCCRVTLFAIRQFQQTNFPVLRLRAVDGVIAPTGPTLAMLVAMARQRRRPGRAPLPSSRHLPPHTLPATPPAFVGPPAPAQVQSQAAQVVDHVLSLPDATARHLYCLGKDTGRAQVIKNIAPDVKDIPEGLIAWMGFGCSPRARLQYGKEPRKYCVRAGGSRVGAHRLKVANRCEEARRHLTAGFKTRLVEICNDLRINPNYLITCIAFESGFTFDPDIACPHSTATGLIQFTRDTARGLGFCVSQLHTMTAEKQLDLVHKLFAGYRGKLHSVDDVYAVIHYPSSLHKKGGDIIYRKPADVVSCDGDNRSKSAYCANEKLDTSKDYAVSRNEMCQRVRELLQEGKLYLG